MAGLHELDLIAVASERVSRDGRTVTNVHRLNLGTEEVARRSSRTRLYSHVLVVMRAGRPVAMSWHLTEGSAARERSRHGEGRIVALLDEGGRL
ncbi:MAG: hypothetical protein RIB67_07350 [Miltoncostaeaceae bacterium]